MPGCEGISRLKPCQPMRRSRWCGNPPWSGSASGRLYCRLWPRWSQWFDPSESRVDLDIYFTETGIDRCYCELCALSELCVGLRSGDIWVQGSRRYRKFHAYLTGESLSAERKEKLLARAESALDCETCLSGRKQLLDQELKKVAGLTRQLLLPEARMEGSQLIISPLTRSGPDQTEKWAERVYALLPRIHLTQLLEEVDE